MMTWWKRAALAGGCVVLLAQAAAAGGGTAFGTYGPPYRPISMPPNGPGSFQVTGDCLADGRIVAVTGNSVYLESAPGTGTFAVVAHFDAAQSGGSSDPAFVRVSPDGSSIAVGLGLGRPIAVVPVGALGTPASPAVLTAGLTRYYHVPHTEAAWADTTRLGITFGVFGSPSAVSLLDVTSPVGNPLNPTVIDGIGGASGGIAFDGAGRLFTGNGYDLGPGGSTTGTIRAFPRSAWDGVLTPTPFETAGILVGEVLSAASLLFDGEWNLVVGGGDYDAGDTGYLGVVGAPALGAAMSGLGPIDSTDPAQLLRLAPRTDPFAYYGGAYNRATGELYATHGDFLTGANTWYATVPTPGAAGTALLGAAGVALTRRRRRCA
jgi:hypothetical protein